MKFKIIIITFFLTSCIQSQQSSIKNYNPYSSKGFALLYNQKDYNDKIISKKLDNEKLQIGHKKLSINKIVLLTNPENNRSIQIKVTKKMNYPNFFNVVITKKVQEELGLNNEFPFIEVYETVKNKSFVAKKAEMHVEEKKVSNKAPVTKIKIANISKNKNNNNNKITKNKKFEIPIGIFYSEESAKVLKKNLVDKYIKKDHLKVKKLGKNRYELSAGPYFSINTLKNAYFELNKYGFEDLDIKQNDY